MDVTPGLPATDNFQHWAPWRTLVVETARSVLEYTGGTLVVPMTVIDTSRITANQAAQQIEDSVLGRREMN